MIDKADEWSLVALTARAAAHYAPLEHIAYALEMYPQSICRMIIASMSNERLRMLEHEHLFDQKQAFDQDIEAELQLSWQRRCKQVMLVPSSPNDYRRILWEHEFRKLLRTNAQATLLTPTNTEANDDAAQQLQISLFSDVVQVLKLHGREIIPRNYALITRLQQLRRLEIHHPEQQRTCWKSMVQIIASQSSLQAIGFFHGKLNDVQLDQIRSALLSRQTSCPIVQLELVSVRIRARGYQQLLALLCSHDLLTTLRVTSTITDFENEKLIKATMVLPSLERICLDHNDLEDDAFTSLTTHDQPISWKRLELGHNALTAPTMRALCSAASRGHFAVLESLELMHNTEIHDAGIQALAPMLQSAVASPSLQSLDLRNCGFGLEGAQHLLHALQHHPTITYVDLSQNFFGSAFGDVLADFITTNTVIQSLHVNYVGLGTAGCTPRLQDALAVSSSLESLAIGANRLRDGGMSLLFRSLVQRGAKKSWHSIDISGNLLTVKGLQRMLQVLEKPFDEEIDERPTKRLRFETLESPRIHELSILNNDFNGEAAQGVQQRLRSFVGRLHSNDWTETTRTVYDDEV